MGKETPGSGVQCLTKVDGRVDNQARRKKGKTGRCRIKPNCLILPVKY
jgi:hypothetical protein